MEEWARNLATASWGEAEAAKIADVGAEVFSGKLQAGSAIVRPFGHLLALATIGAECALGVS
eukprot:568529-Lingulodinium_polyedra.AAC.1